MTAYGVERRTSEIGMRVALGADRRSVVAMVLGGASLQIAAGLALGIPAAIASGRLITNQLFDVGPWDPLLLLGAVGLLVATALGATFIPAWRAASLDPMQALRVEFLLVRRRSRWS